MKNICPICGLDGLDFKPYDEKGFGTFEICPCCGFEFGCDDFPDKEASWLEWRKDWICEEYFNDFKKMFNFTVI